MNNHLLCAFETLAVNQAKHSAVISYEHTLSYAQLNQYATDLAKQIISYPKPSSGLVAIVTQKGWEEVVAVLAVLKAGLAYVPINANESEEWIRSLLLRTEVNIVLTQNHNTPKIKWPKSLSIIHIGDVLTHNQHAQQLRPFNNCLAYIVFTSGSTGIPKGVMTEHSAVNRATFS